MIIKDYKKFLKENKNSKIPLPKDIIDISDAYIDAGKDIFLVGGSIRDFLQGKEPKDFDLVTNALPDESKKILKDFNVSDEQGKSFGVIRVYTKDEPLGYEIASYRKDISGGRDTKGDDQKVEMGEGVTIEDDCNRRDLTINALFYDIKREKIVDLVGGIDDIKNGIIRAVGDPKKRFLEDRLRILRVFRFAARSGGIIDEQTSNAIKSDNRLRGISPKDDVSQDRIWDEFTKSWKQVNDFTKYLELLTEYDMWDEIFPGSVPNLDFIKSKNFIITLSNLFKFEETESIERKLIQNWKIETNTARKITFLLNFLTFEPKGVFEFYKKKVNSKIDDFTLLEWIELNKLDDSFKKFIKYKPSVSSEDLIKSGFSGRDLGLEIRRLEFERFKTI